MTEDEVVGWHHWLNEHEFEQTLGVGEGRGSLVCCIPWDRKKLDTTDQLNNQKYFNLKKSNQFDPQPFKYVYETCLSDSLILFLKK